MGTALCVFVSKHLVLSLQEQLVTWEQVPLSEKSILMWKLTKDPRKPGTLDQINLTPLLSGILGPVWG